MADRSDPVPQTAGALGPPDRHPPTAVGVATPPPPPGRGRVVRATPAGPLRRAIQAGLGQLRHLAGSVGRAIAGVVDHRAPHGRH